MGTNYYHEPDPINTAVCKCCGEPLRCERCEPERQHIGKASAGWTFGFHATDTIRSYRDWLAVLEKGGRIVNEYGDTIDLDRFKAMVEHKRNEPNHHARQAQAGAFGVYGASGHFTDPEGHSFSEGEFS